MQRTRAELEAMPHEDLVDRILELQDMLREGLAVRDSLHAVLNQVLLAKGDEVARFAESDGRELSETDRDLREAWAAARHAVANPRGLVKRRE